MFQTDEEFTKELFKEIMGYELDLKNPKTFNEKICSRKIKNTLPLLPLHSLCTDKIVVKSWVKDRIDCKYIIPTLQIVNIVSEIDFNKLPDKFIIKAAHGSGWNILVDKNVSNLEEVLKQCEYFLNHNYYYKTREKQYQYINKRLLIEPIIHNNPNDYKFHIFNNEIVFIQLDVDRNTQHTRNLYDQNWNEYKLSYKCKNIPYEVHKPSNLEEMKSIALKLAKGFDYVRVDLYSIKNATCEDSIYFGELTFTPESGFGKFEPFSFDEYLGTLLS